MKDSVNIDYLTGLNNRKALSEFFEALAVKTVLQLMFIDLDNFKTVNDMYGHKAGDDVLIGVAEILKDIAPEEAFVVRLGGDEFVLCIPGVFERDHVADIGASILTGIKSRRGSIVGFDIISASIGIVWDACSDAGLDELLSYSDAAMYKAKELGKDNYVFFDDYEDKIIDEKEMEATAARALKEGKFTIKYHPVIHLQSSKLVRTEACCFWMRPDGRMWGRNDYRPVLEKNGFIKELDLHIFEELCKQMRKLTDAGRKDDILSVQFSYLLLLQDDILDILTDIMDKYKVEASNFEINLEEMVFGPRGSERLMFNMRRLHEAGFLLALTRFGEDFSSFRYLDDMSISALKFDAEYVRENLASKRGRKILNTLFELGRDLKLLVVGCGVTSKEDVEFLASAGCDAASGRYYAEHLTFTEYLDYVNESVAVSGTEHVYRFKGNLEEQTHGEEAQIIGEGVVYTEGISNDWGGLSFPGGKLETNLVSFPVSNFLEGSYTLAFWIKPAEIQNWISAFFMRYKNGFASFMPSVSGGVSIFRIHEEAHADVWHDNIIAGIPMGQWSFVSAVFDSFGGSVRLYINGELRNEIYDVPDMRGCMCLYLGGDIYQVSFRGVISAFQIYHEAKTSDEIEELYNSFKSEAGYHGDEVSEAENAYVMHDPAIYEDRETNRFYIYTTDGNGWRSQDLMHWTMMGRVVDKVGDAARSWTGSDAIWAPDIVKVGREYRLYCSNSSWGVQRSCIFLAVSYSPDGPFVTRDIVLKTDETLDVNGIDANIIEDNETGEQYMVYGSFWGGVHILPLDKQTGLARDAGTDGSGVGSIKLMSGYTEEMNIMAVPEDTRIKRRGIGLACRPLWNNGAIEGPYMIYHPETEYYYLFVSYGSLMSDYNIRVGRSKNITGPFLDYNGRALNDVTDDRCEVGLMICCGYKWLDDIGYMGPGHNSVLLRENGDMYLVSHIRKQRFLEDNPGPGYLQIRKMYMTPDGWPVISSETYSEESYTKPREEVVPGLYERIEMRPSIPQGIMHSHPMTLFPDGKLEMCSVMGSWKRTGDHTLELKYGPITEYVHMEKGIDKEKNKTSVLMCGLTNQGICTWAKKKEYQ
ncbi:MAG: EAL domain-containing protein [Lachnospiraceae bacterium]|nr:EAL domain-containing protein [Lachnospiraceae bacterium]